MDSKRRHERPSLGSIRAPPNAEVRIVADDGCGQRRRQVATRCAQRAGFEEEFSERAGPASAAGPLAIRPDR